MGTVRLYGEVIKRFTESFVAPFDALMQAGERRKFEKRRWKGCGIPAVTILLGFL